MKATDFVGQEIERMQRAAMGHSRIFEQIEEARKMLDLTSAYSAAQEFLNLDNRWKKEIEQLTRTHLSIDHISNYRAAMESLSGSKLVLGAAQNWNEIQGLSSALSSANVSLESLASKIANDFEASQRLLREQLGLSAAQTLASVLASEREIASLKGYAASAVSKALGQGAMELSKGLQMSFALARAAGTAGIEKALANSIGNIASQYAGLDLKDRLREMVDGMSTFDLATTAALARFHGIDGLARQMAALGIDPGEFLNEEYLKTEREEPHARSYEHRKSMLSTARLDVFQQILINIIAAYIWVLFIAPTIPNPDLEAQNKNIAKVELLIEKLPQLIESQLEDIIRRQLDVSPPTFVVKDRIARLRTEPVAGASVIALVFPNQKLILLEERGKWIRVEFYDYLTETTREGWVLKKYCLRLAQLVSAKPARDPQALEVLVEEIKRTRKGRSLEGISIEDLIHEGHKY